MPASPAWWLRLVRLGGCYLLGLIAVGLLLVALLMTGQFRVVALWQASGLPLWPVTVVQAGAASEGLMRAWPQPSSGVATHHGYAFQWFAISAVLAVMVLWFQWLRPLRNVQASHVAQPD